MIELTNNPIDANAVLSSVYDHGAGAVVFFLGTTREFTQERQTDSLDYQCYPEMAVKKLEELEAEAREKWPVIGCSIVHRLGRLELGEASVAIAVSTPHRRDAYEASQWIIDRLKQIAPIWKQENWSDGTSQWVHPGMASETETKP